MTHQAVLWLLGASLFAAAFAHDLWRGKTIFFPLATVDRNENALGFWLAEGVAAFLTIVCVYQAWAAQAA
jgi:hypothetical protein